MEKLDERLTERTLMDIGYGQGLRADRLTHYVRFVQARFPWVEATYASEWAKAFKRGGEWGKADDLSQGILADTYRPLWAG